MKKTITVLITLTFFVACGGKKPPSGGGHTPKKDGISLNDISPVTTCNPILEWNSVHIPNAAQLTYDVAVYKGEEAGSKSYTRSSNQVFRKENFPLTSVNIVPALQAKTVYFWSIRVRQPDGKVSQWSTNSKTVKRPPAVATYDKRWHAFVTPDACEKASSINEAPAERPLD